MPLCEISETEIFIKVPNGSMSEDLNQMHVHATMPCGNVEVTLNPVGHALFNAGSGYSPMLDMNIHQYSLPILETAGAITIEGKTYDISGTSWFDRQW